MNSPFLQSTCGCIYLPVPYGLQILVEHCKWSEDGPQLIFTEASLKAQTASPCGGLRQQEHKDLVSRINKACIQAYQWQRMADVIAIHQK